MTLLQRVEELTLAYGNDSKQAIGEFIMHKKSRLRDYTIGEIAAQTYTSKSALVRFAKALGYSGWREFVKEFVSEQHYQENHYSDIDPNFPFSEGNSTADIIRKLSSLEVESILDTADLLEPRTVEKVAALLQKARRIALFGTSPNHLLGELFRRRMLTIGRQVEIPVLGDTGLLASSLTAQDCAIIISYSGNSVRQEPLSVLDALEPNGVPIVAITSSGDNALRRHAKYTFTISSRERLYSKISTFATEKSIQYILDVLFSCYFEQDYQGNLERKINTGKRLEFARIATNTQLEEGPAPGSEAEQVP